MKKTLVFIACTLLWACTNPKEELTRVDTITSIPQTPRKVPIDVNMMGYSSATELYTIYANDPNNVVHYAVARLLAETELMAGANMALNLEEYANGSWHLTTFPKIVYNYDNSPKYYEFGYVYDNQIVATITTYAKKEIAGVIAYIFPEPLSYDCRDLDFYVGDYPNRYYGAEGVCYLKNCDEELEGDLFPQGTDEEKRNFMWEQMDDEDRNGILLDMNDLDENLDDDIRERDEYWALIDAFVDEYLSELLEVIDPTIINPDLNKDDIINGSVEPESEADLIRRLLELLDYAVGYYNAYTLPGYTNLRLQITHWGGFCGPAACAWVYRGKYSSYNGVYLPLYGDGSGFVPHYCEYTDPIYAAYSYATVVNRSNLSGSTVKQNYIDHSFESDNGLAACFYEETVPTPWTTWQFPLYHAGMNRGFRAATNNAYHVKFTCKPYKWILNNQQPVIIAIDCSHYIVAFGTANTIKRNGRVKDKYFMVTDNGSRIGNYNFRPYMRKKNGWNLHYGLTH